MLLHEDIKEILPHRFPMLLIDRVTEVSETTIQGYKNVSANEAFFQGHFPNDAIMPGVLILEALAQCGAIWVLSKPEYSGKIVLFGGADNVKWRYQVTPGDRLDLKVEITNMRMGVGKGIATASVDGHIACTASLTFAVK